MKKSKLISLISVCLFASALPAQSPLKTIAIGNSSNPAGLSAGDVSLFEGAALKGIRQPKLCIALERTEWEKILKERGIQKTEDFLDGKIAEQGVSLGAEYLMILNFQTLDISDKYSPTIAGVSSRSVDVSLSVGAKVVSIETGEVLNNKTVMMKKNATYTNTDPMYNAPKADIYSKSKEEFVNKCSWEFSQFTFELFPPEITIVRVEETDKKGKSATKILCKTGAKMPEAARLLVYTQNTIDLGDGDTDIQKVKVGEMKITTVNSEKSVSCTVTDGGDELLKLVNNGTKLKCEPVFEGKKILGLNNPFEKKPEYGN